MVGSVFVHQWLALKLAVFPIDTDHYWLVITPKRPRLMITAASWDSSKNWPSAAWTGMAWRSVSIPTPRQGCAPGCHRHGDVVKSMSICQSLAWFGVRIVTVIDLQNILETQEKWAGLTHISEFNNGKLQPTVPYMSLSQEEGSTQMASTQWHWENSNHRFAIIANHSKEYLP